MTSRPLRLFHASDFRLDRPCEAAPGLPKPLLDLFVDARYRAVTKLVTTCIEQNVDVLVLAGGLLDPELTGLRGPWHLVEQFGRLQDAGIDVVWCGSHVDAPHRWPEYVGLPANVRRFAPSARTPVVIQRPGAVPLVVAGVHATNSTTTPDNAFRVVLAPKESDATVDANYDYFAGGGRSKQHIAAGQSAAWPGSPQGRSSDESGEHGGLLVTIQPDGTKTIEPVATDVIRWHTISRTLDSNDRYDDVVAGLRAELLTLAEETTDCEAHIATIIVEGSGLAAARFRSPSRRAELHGELSELLNGAVPPVWLAEISVAAEPPSSADADLLADIAETETVLIATQTATADPTA